jgi:hypothetical protein
LFAAKSHAEFLGVLRIREAVDDPPLVVMEDAVMPLLEAEVDEAIANCGGDVRAALRATLIANTYLEAEIERLTEAISTGFARGRMRKPPQRVKIERRCSRRCIRL